MTVLFIILSFTVGFILGKSNFEKAKKPSEKAKEISNIRNFLTYDGTEQTD